MFFFFFVNHVMELLAGEENATSQRKTLKIRLRSQLFLPPLLSSVHRFEPFEVKLHRASTASSSGLKEEK